MMVMTTPIRIGFIGCGGISWTHGERFAATGKVSVVAGAEPVQAHFDRVKHFMADGAPRFDDYREMIEKVELDGVMIATPHNVHYEQIVTCLDRGLHVLTEKPMVCTVEHAKDVCARAEKSDKVLAVAYQRHYQAQFRYIKDSIEKGLIGDVQYVNGVQSQNWYESQVGKWRQVMEESCGGQLNDSGSHMVDIILWMTGLKAKRVFAKVDFFDREVDINSSTTLEFDNGATGNVAIIGNSKIEFFEDISIWGSEGAFMLRMGQPLRYWDKDFKEYVIGTKEIPPESDPNAAFIDAILGGPPVLTPAECGLRTIELTENIWKSGETGQPIQIL